LSGGGYIKRGKIGNSLVEIGKFTYGYNKISIKQWGEGASLKIGSFCSIADEVVVMLGGNHRVDWITTFPFGHVFSNELGSSEIEGHPRTNGDVIIGNDVWVGRNSTIMSGVKIGDGAVIAANSTVVKDIGCYEIWGGNPAKKIKLRFEEKIINELIEMKWWNYDIELIRKIVPLLSQAPTLEVLGKIKYLASMQNINTIVI